MILYALTKGFLDDVPVADVLRFESELFTFIEHNKKELFDHIRSTGALPEDADLVAAIEEFKKGFTVLKSVEWENT